MKQSRTGGTTIWMVRHGESTWNVQGLIQGQSKGPCLTEKGHQQAEAVAAHFRGKGVGTIYSSDLERARQTAARIGSVLGLPVTHDAALRERCFGTQEGQPLSTLGVSASGIADDRVVNASARPEGGESLDEVYERVGSFLQWVDTQHHEGDVIFVTHGGAIRALRAYCAGMPMNGIPWDEVANSSVTGVHRPAAVRTPS